MNYVAERRQEERERRRAEILDAAEAVLERAGWDELTMEQVARQARLSRALVYVYFKDKVDLLFGVCERALTVLKQRFEDAVARNKSGLDQITAIGRAYIAYSQEFPVYFDIKSRCDFRESDPAEASPNEAACRAAGDSILALMVGVMERGVRDGSIRADIGNRLLAATALWGFTHGVLQLSVSKGKLLAHRGVGGRELLDQAMAMAVRAVAAKT